MVEPLLGVGEVGHSLFEGGDVVLFCWGGGGGWMLGIFPSRLYCLFGKRGLPTVRYLLLMKP